MNFKSLAIATTVALCGLATVANAQEISRIGGAPGGPFVAITGVPMGGGMTMYFVSGALPTPVTPPANGQPANWGDTTAQTKSVFENIKKSMATAAPIPDSRSCTRTSSSVWSRSRPGSLMSVIGPFRSMGAGSPSPLVR